MDQPEIKIPSSCQKEHLILVSVKHSPFNVKVHWKSSLPNQEALTAQPHVSCCFLGGVVFYPCGNKLPSTQHLKTIATSLSHSCTALKSHRLGWVLCLGVSQGQNQGVSGCVLLPGGWRGKSASQLIQAVEVSSFPRLPRGSLHLQAGNTESLPHLISLIPPSP